MHNQPILYRSAGYSAFITRCVLCIMENKVRMGCQNCKQCLLTLAPKALFTTSIDSKTDKSVQYVDRICWLFNIFLLRILLRSPINEAAAKTYYDDGRVGGRGMGGVCKVSFVCQTPVSRKIRRKYFIY